MPAHIVMLPFAQQGHINPMMQLARCLAARGATVTFVVSENTLPSAGTSETAGLQFVGVPDNLPAERARGSSFKDSVDSMVGMEEGFRHFLQQRCSEQSPAGVSALIYDGFMSWAPSIAASLSVLCICFFTTNATCCSLAFQLHSLIQRGILPFRPDGDEDGPLPTEVVPGADGVPDLLPEEFPYEITFPADHFRYKFLKRKSEVMRLQTTAIIINTMAELEPEAIAALRARKRIFTLGPLLLLSGRPSRLDVNYWPEEGHCLPWLDSHPPSSVLYVSFGSVASLPLPHFQQLALGLEASGHPFLWVVRPDSIDAPLEHALPHGFLARTKDRGLIITWGPQLSILSHPSVGGFLTHGGWNSILENLSMGSVPMICWPHVAEQRMNRRLIDERWKIGLRLQYEADGSVRKEEIARIVCELLGSESGKDVRDASSKLGEMARQAVASGGSSYDDFEAMYSYLSLANKDSRTCEPSGQN